MLIELLMEQRSFKESIAVSSILTAESKFSLLLELQLELEYNQKIIVSQCKITVVDVGDSTERIMQASALSVCGDWLLQLNRYE